MRKAPPPAKSTKAPASWSGSRDASKAGAGAATDTKATDRRGGPAENDRAASHQSGVGAKASQRDMTSGRGSGNQ